MGCSGSKGSSTDATNDERRKRLSVGAGSGGANVPDQNGTGTEEEDRGEAVTIPEHADIFDLIGSTCRKISFSSQPDPGKPDAFTQKQVAQRDSLIGGDTKGGNGGNLLNGLVGYQCRKGLKPESPNQDSWSVIIVENGMSMYSVYDGHGSKGHDVSDFVKKQLPKLIVNDPRVADGVIAEDDAESIFTDAFVKMQAVVQDKSKKRELDAQLSGTTVTVAVYYPSLRVLYTAHVADSTAVLASLPSGGSIKATQLTRDHKPDLKEERQRIEAAGGRVVFDGYANHRVYQRGARYPGLNMSRCIGDLLGHDCGISCRPEVTRRTITEEDQFLLVCSDGVWEFITPQEAVEIVWGVFQALSTALRTEKLMQASEKLAKFAWDRWVHEENSQVVDDITVVLTFLDTEAVTPAGVSTEVAPPGNEESKNNVDVAAEPPTS